MRPFFSNRAIIAENWYLKNIDLFFTFFDEMMKPYYK